MLFYVFGKTNQKTTNYLGNEGLKLAILEVRFFFNKNQRLPQTSDLPQIARAIYRGHWREQDINSWKDILNKYANI